MQEESTSLPASVRLPFEANSHAITAFFKHMSVLNVPQSETRGEPVYELKEMVELRFAGDRNYSPCFEATEMWRNVGGRVITYAERFAEQYRAFTMGDSQVAGGTALEMLRPYGITPAQISICNALKVYSIEAILEMRTPQALGMSTNVIMEMAKRWQADQAQRAQTETKDSIATLQAEIERLQALIPAREATGPEIDAALSAADAEFGAMSDDDLKAFIKERSGQAPRGTPSRAFLLNAARELAA
jgi:uncharacterized small protein (DUF1192 family)